MLGHKWPEHKRQGMNAGVSAVAGVADFRLVVWGHVAESKDGGAMCYTATERRNIHTYAGGTSPMAAAVHLEAIVQEDGKIELAIPDLMPGQRVRITVEIADDTLAPAVYERGLAPGEVPASPRQYTALELMKLPLAERHRILEEAAEEAAEEYRTNPDLTEFDAFGEDDLYDDHPE